jgi:hypothetical protein
VTEKRNPLGIVAAVVAALAAVGVAAALLIGGGDVGSGGTATSSATTIAQPGMGKLNHRTRSRLAPEGRRVDLAAPTFSNPTEITNPLFPISNLDSALLLGKLRGKPWRAETTLLPETKIVDWNGQAIEARQSQFVAYLDGRIFEVAVDLYAQADDGSVWYLGEDAFTYGHGRVADTEGTWVAGVQGPAALIMPAHPEVGDVYRTENVPGLVFEQVTVKKVGEAVNGPTGPVQGAMIGQELHMDEQRLEDKTFAPGYGEFFSGGGRTYEATALAMPVYAASGSTPVEIQRLAAGARSVFDAVEARDWRSASATIGEMKAALVALRADSPKRLYTQMNSAVDSVGAALRTRQSRQSSSAALDLAQAGLDLQLPYRTAIEANRSRFDLWTRELRVDSAAGDAAAVRGDLATLKWIRDRIALGQR